MVSPAAVEEQISNSEEEEEEDVVPSQQVEEDEALARRLQAEDNSVIGTCRCWGANLENDGERRYY